MCRDDRRRSDGVGFTQRRTPASSRPAVREPEVQASPDSSRDVPSGPLVFVQHPCPRAGRCDLDRRDGDQAASVRFEAYTPGTAYGTIKRYRLQDLDRATAAADYGPRDILVLDQAPIDVERVVSAVVTARQGSLSYINAQRSRGTPIFVHEAMAALAPGGRAGAAALRGDTRQVEPATAAEAEPWWSSARARPDPTR